MTNIRIADEEINMGDTTIHQDFQGTVWAQIGVFDKNLFYEAAIRLNEIANQLIIKNPTSEQAWEEARKYAKASAAIREVCHLCQ